MKEINGLNLAVNGLEIFVIVFIVAINFYIFGFVYPTVQETVCDFCTYEKDLTLAVMFIVPIPSVFMIWSMVSSNLDEHIRNTKERRNY